MSTWTEVTGIIVCDWCSFSNTDNEIQKDINERRQQIINILMKNRPIGSESPLYIHCDNNLNIIIITGSLRDFNEDDINNKIVPWWNNIIKNLDYIRQGVMSCTCNRKTHIFEKRIISDADLGGEISKLYGPDPGIVIHSNREIIRYE